MYIGYVYYSDGYYSKPFYFTKSIDKLVAFIDQTRGYENVLILNSGEELVLSVHYGFVIDCKDEELKQEILSKLDKVYVGKITAEILEFVEFDRLLLETE